MRLEVALEYAKEMKKALYPFCEPGRCEIAGSIRRQKADVGDVEIVAIPQRIPLTRFFLAAKAIANTSQTITRETRYVKLNKSTPYGMLQFDLFLPMPYDWGRILAIRTGSAEYVRHIFAKRWRQKGFVGTEYGLLPEKYCFEKAGKWHLLPGVDPANYRVIFPDEKTFFTWLGLPWVEPKCRLG